jgi:hypothetical protein
VLTARLQSVSLILDVHFQGLPQPFLCVSCWLAAHPTSTSFIAVTTEPVSHPCLPQYPPHLQSVCLILKITFQGTLQFFIGL